MPKKTKEQDNLKEFKKDTKKSASSKTATSKKATTTKTKTTATKKATTSKINTTTAKKITTTKKATSSKKKATTKKTSTSSKKETKKIAVVEYYDLPYRYNQTVVKILAQTPNNLFIYWDISDDDRENYKEEYGENFFETTKPVLIVHNETLNYSFEVDINDFANSWYLQVNDSKCNYKIELGRRPISSNKKINTNYINIATSNEIESPNDHILFDKNQKMVYFKNIKTNEVTSKPVTTLSFIKNMGKIYNIYDLYKQIYKDENVDNIINPSSHTSSQFK